MILKKTIIIAEAGVNHNGSIEIAKKLIEAAAYSGVDYVKFQTFKAGNLVTNYAHKGDYQKKNLVSEDNSQLNMLKKLELSFQQHYELIGYSEKCGIKFLSTAFDLESVDFLVSLNLGLWKIPSGEITNYPYLKKIALQRQPTILSTGMSTINEIKEAVELLERYGLNKEQITVLHCNTQYPTPFCDVNLLAMQTIANEIRTKIGYSDHTSGIEVPIAAVALGACVIEKHFTLDRNMSGPDHKASLEPEELKNMTNSIRNIEVALGTAEKAISESEKENINIARKSIVAACKINEGEPYTELNITVKRPGNGVSPMRWEEALGKKAQKNYNPDDLIEL